jgi:Zn-dependent M28 family amino/carboxypeptidase
MKKFFILISFFVFFLIQCSPQNEESGTSKYLTKTISSQNIRSTISDLIAFENRYTWENQNQVAENLYHRLKRYNSLAVFYESYEADNRQWKNVIGRYMGKQHSEKLYVFCAHYDSISSGSTPAPGANDNATGVAVLLEVARVLSDTSCKNTIEFVFFSNEEQDHKGSKAYVEKRRAQGLNIEGTINVDTIGYTNPSVFFIPPKVRNRNLGYRVFYLVKKTVKRPILYFQTGFKDPDEIVLLGGRPKNKAFVEKLYSIIEPSEIGIKKEVGPQCG